MFVTETLTNDQMSRLDSDDFLVFEAELSRVHNKEFLDDASRPKRLLGCDGLEPGLVSAVQLAYVEALTEFSDAGLVRVLQAHNRQWSFDRAKMLKAVAAVVTRYEAQSDDMAEAIDRAENELMAALTITRRAARMEIELALNIVHRIPSLVGALISGQLDERRIKVIARETRDLDDELANVVCAEVLAKAPALTTSEIRSWIRRLRINVHPEEAKSRFEQAVEERRIFCELTEDGTATITAIGLQPDRAARVMNRIAAAAITLRNPSEARCVDQLRTDVFLDMLEGTSPSTQKGVIDIRADLTTFMALNDNSVELSGYGPVIADIGRQIANRSIVNKGGEWRFTVTDPTGGSVTGLTRRRPTASESRLVESRDVTCVFPGCRAPSTSCDLDHRIPYSEGGRTHPEQLVPLCRKDHVVRHRGWTHSSNGDGTHTWSSPFNLIYTTTRAP
jgi:hypothetical protein